MPDIYIARAGMNNKELDEKFTNTELGELKLRLSKEEYERKRSEEEMEKMKKDIEKMKLEAKEVVKVVSKLSKTNEILSHHS